MTESAKKPAASATKGGGALDRLKARAVGQKLQEAPTIKIPLSLIDFDPNQPRIAFHAADGMVSKSDEEELADLAKSIKVNGLIHPITVSENGSGRYLVRVGERRTRATMLNGEATIDARVRNDLTGMRALALQMAENTDRQNLTEREIALTIQRFVVKSEENPVPMKKKEVAEMMGKSDGWVTRYLAYGDEALQEKWIQPGYLNTVETLYQVSVLPGHIQELIYADLSTGKMESPLNWKGLQYYKNLAKNREAMQVAQAVPASNAVAESAAPVVGQNVSQVDAIAAALNGADDNGLVSGASLASLETWPFAPGSNVSPQGTAEGAETGSNAPVVPEAKQNNFGDYVLPVTDAADLRVPTFTGGDASATGGPSAVRGTPGMMQNSAVPCRVPMSVLANLVSVYGTQIEGIEKIEVDFRLTSASAVSMVRAMTGETVPEDRVQVMLAKALEALR